MIRIATLCALIFSLELHAFQSDRPDNDSVAYLDSLNQIALSLGCRNRELSDSLIATVLNTALENEYWVQAGKATGNKARNLSCEGEYQQATEMGRKSVVFFRKAGDLKGEADVISVITASYRKLHKIDSSLWFSKRILEIAKETGDVALEAKSYSNHASCFIENHHHDSALYYSLAALKIIESMPESPDFTPAILHNLAISYNMGDELEKAKVAYMKAEKAYETGNYRLGLPISIYNNFGRCLVDLGQYDSAILIYEKGLRINEELDNDFMHAYINRGLGRAYWLKNDVAKAIEHNLLSKTFSERSSLVGNLAVVLSNLTKYYTASGNLRQAIKHGEEGLTVTEKTGNRGIRKVLLTNLASAYESSGDLKRSLELLKEQIVLEKELQEAAMSREFARLETQYETEKKDQQIELLSQQAAIQALEIRQKNQGIIIGFAVALIIILAISFIYKQRASKRKEMQTELEQRFLRSQLNPHFISNALVAVQSFILKNKSEAAALYLTKFSKLMREILENSRKEFIPVEEEISMLTNYLDIHKLRFSDSFEYEIEIDPKISPEEDTIPPMFVQPFVENAIEHGIINSAGKGKIGLHFVKEDGYIAIEVRDNGKGLSTESKSSDHTSLSTTIIRERMEQFNKSLKTKIQLVLDEIRNDKGEIEGTKVELKVPFSYI